MARKRRKNEAMQSGTKLALTISAVAIATGVVIKVARALNRKRALEG